MRRDGLLAILLLACVVLAWRLLAPQPAQMMAPAAAPLDPATVPARGAEAGTRVGTESEWIVAEVVGAIDGMARVSPPAPTSVSAGPDDSFLVTPAPGHEPLRLTVVDHIWSPGMYAAFAGRALADRPAAAPPADAPTDLRVRTALTNLTSAVLLEQNERVSAALRADMRSTAAQESAALLVGAFALREAMGPFSDVRKALSRMAAHLAVAQALRGSTPESLDGMLARAILTTLAGRQRDAMTLLESIETRALAPADLAWIRALRLRTTGDWRMPARPDGETLLERFEHARALRIRVGNDAFTSFLDTLPPDTLTDWQHTAFLNNWAGVEAGGRFVPNAIARELAEAGRVWSTLHGTAASPDQLIAALDDRPDRSPVRRSGSGDVVQVLDWGMWAAFLQRHICQAVAASHYYFASVVDPRAQYDLLRTSETRFGRLALYPIVLRWIATTPQDFNRAMAGARGLVQRAPDLVTAAEWNYLLEKPSYIDQVVTFPLDLTWFTPLVPSGTAYDLPSRSLRAGCPRPPTLEQLAVWVRAMPYDPWTQWAGAWRPVEGKPSRAAVRKAFGQLLEYDEDPLLKILDYIDASTAEDIATARTLCHIAVSRCDRLGELLVRDGRSGDALGAYERWIAGARDTVNVANELTWIVRYYDRHGERARAEALARKAAATGSARGREVLADLLDRAGRYAEAETVYRAIAERYPDYTTPLGAFLLRKALRDNDTPLRMKALELLRPAFPIGIDPLMKSALDPEPKDGMMFRNFGRRAAATGLEPGDIVVGVDGWRVRSYPQYQIVALLRHDEMMTFTVWRGGRYRDVQARVPERWLGLTLGTFAAS